MVEFGGAEAWLRRTEWWGLRRWRGSDYCCCARRWEKLDSCCDEWVRMCYGLFGCLKKAFWIFFIVWGFL